MAVPFLACMVATAAFYHLPPRVLPAILEVEGGRPGLASRNADGSEDLGPMQVNTAWLPWLAAAAGLTPDEVRARLLADPCFNIAAAGRILRSELDTAGGDLMVSVGHYHSHTPGRAAAYRARVLAAAVRLFVRPPPGR